MPTFIILVKLTDQGMKDIKGLTERINKLMAAGGQQPGEGRITGLWWTQGQYDAVLVGEWPDAESVSVAALSAAIRGHYRGETLRAFTSEEMVQIVQRLT
jgi:uncharacterized protein with GYD domain